MTQYILDVLRFVCIVLQFYIILKKVLLSMGKALLLFFLSMLPILTYKAEAQDVDSFKTNPAAHFILKGSIKDTTNFINCGYASVSVLRASDSVLQSYTRTDENGNFTLQVNSPASYLLLVSHPSFAIYIDLIDIKEPVTTLAPIIMTSKKQMLNEVVITDAKAIVLKGDTIVYTADSFKTTQFANVDELLKKLPGIEIDKDGKIKAYGKVVKKMTVDGEEFFSDDPAIVAQTLRASAVSKVQVFDKKSDQAAFSGVDDGERIKTINLQLKDAAKKGYFGKAQAGGGLPDYWENQAMINAFKGKQKIAAYGIMSNTNSNGLGWEDESKYGKSNSYVADENGIMNLGDDNDGDLNGQFQGSGLPKGWVAGGLYNNKWMGDSLTFNSNYRFSKKIAESEENINSQYILPDTQYFNTQHTDSRSIAVRNNINTTTEYLIDTSSSLKVILNGSNSTINNLTHTKSGAYDSHNTLINESDVTHQNETSNNLIHTDILYKKRFKKKGRTFTADFTGKLSEGKGNGLLQSDYSLIAIDSTYLINQRKQSSSNNETGQLKLTYTEPLSEAFNLLFNYSSGVSNSSSSNNSYDRQSDPSVYTDVFNPAYSSNFKVNINQNQGGVGLRYNTKKINASIGGNILETRYKQEDKLYDTTYHYNYLNLLPTASFAYNASQSVGYTFRYSGRPQQPLLTQLQPLRNNNDPLNVTIGNPDLKQSFIHDLTLGYNSFKMLSQRYINFYGNVVFKENDITLKQYIDNSGRSVSQYVNVKGDYNANIWLGVGRKIKSFYTNAQLNGNYDHQNNFVNGLANVNNQLTLNPTMGMYYSKDTTWNISYNFSPQYNLSQSSIRTDVVTKYWAFNQRISLDILLPYKFKIGTDVALNLRQKLNPSETNNNVLLWNGYISRAFLKDRSLEAKIYANDLLNQNVGYSRSNTATYISERTYNTIKRYAMLSLTWNFTKTGKESKSANASNDGNGK